MGIKITTDDYGVKVWRSDKYQYPQYAISIQGKDENEQYVTEYKRVKFRRGVEFQNGEEICIDSAFPTLDVWKDKKTGQVQHREVWVVLEYHYASEHKQEQRQSQVSRGSLIDPAELPDSFSAAEDEIPF